MSTTDDVNAATTALHALADTEDGAVLAGQLSRLVLVIAGEAARTKRFRTDLVAALVAEPASGTDDPSDPAARARLRKMTIPELRKLIATEAMDPNRTLKSRATKGEMIDLIAASRKSSTEVAVAAADESPDAQTVVSAEPVVSPCVSGLGELPQSEEQPRQDAAAVSPTVSRAAEDSPVPEAEAQDATPALPRVNPPKRRRRPSPIDPYAVAASEGLEALWEQLQHFDVEELKDVIAEYGMNYDGRAMGWHDHHRFVDRIIEKADFGATQGNAFRSGR